jgi:hypothetical protein
MLNDEKSAFHDVCASGGIAADVEHDLHSLALCVPRMGLPSEGIGLCDEEKFGLLGRTLGIISVHVREVKTDIPVCIHCRR